MKDIVNSNTKLMLYKAEDQARTIRLGIQPMEDKLLEVRVMLLFPINQTNFGLVCL